MLVDVETSFIMVIVQAIKERTHKTGVNSNQYVLDRLEILNNTCHFTVSQSTDVPAGQGFSNSMKMDVTTQQQLFPSAGDYANITQRFEGKHLHFFFNGNFKFKKGYCFILGKIYSHWNLCS